MRTSKFGNNLKKIRMALGLTQQDLSDKTEISTQYISVIERGLRNPSIETAQMIADALNCKVDSLINLDLNKNKSDLIKILNEIQQEET